eukprot:6518097-Pyramimonas_sp.AAC.1
MDRTHPALDNPLKATGISALATRVPRGPYCPYCYQLFIPWTSADCGRAHEERGAQAHHNRLQPGRRG